MPSEDIAEFLQHAHAGLNRRDVVQRRLNRSPGGGRDHWSQAYTCMFAGAGIPRGRVIGRTDGHGGTVTDRPISPKDILATVYHLLGIDPHSLLHDRTGRPQPLTHGMVVNEMIA